MMSRKFKAITLSLCMCTATGFAAQGLSVFHVGNSLTDETYGVHRIAQGFGHTWATGPIYGKSMIPGAPIWWLWDKNVTINDCGFFLEFKDTSWYGEWIKVRYPSVTNASVYLSTKPYDALVMQVFPLNGDSYGKKETVDAILGYSGEAYKSNPNCQVYIYASHTMTVGQKCDTTEYTRTYEPLARAVTAKYPGKKPALVLPIHQVWNQVMDAGYMDLWLSATDGHANDNGKYILQVVEYTCIYKKNPAGATIHGGQNSDMKAQLNVTPAFAAKVEEIAWKVANSYPMSGFSPVNVARPAVAQTAVRSSRVAEKGMINLDGRIVSNAGTKATALAIRIGGVNAVTVVKK